MSAIYDVRYWQVSLYSEIHMLKLMKNDFTERFSGDIFHLRSSMDNLRFLLKLRKAVDSMVIIF